MRKRVPAFRRDITRGCRPQASSPSVRRRCPLLAFPHRPPGVEETFAGSVRIPHPVLFGRSPFACLRKFLEISSQSDSYRGGLVAYRRRTASLDPGKVSRHPLAHARHFVVAKKAALRSHQDMIPVGSRHLDELQKRGTTFCFLERQRQGRRRTSHCSHAVLW